MIEGNIKMESLQYWPGALPVWLREPPVSAREVAL